jgi:hypothetical protein
MSSFRRTKFRNSFSPQETKRKTEARKRWHADRTRAPAHACSSVVRSQRDYRRCLRQIVGPRDHRRAKSRSCRASHLHLASTVQSHVAGSYEGCLVSTVQNSSLKLAIRTLSRCLNLPLISAAPHYGLRYGSAPATGNFQRLRGRPPLVSPLKSCIGRSFTAVTRVQIPSGTPINQ